MLLSDQAQTSAARSAYIHVPFCTRRCGYCNFALVTGRDDLIDPYLEALERELGWLGASCRVETLFVGGGTPTYLRGQSLRRLLSLLAEWHPVAGDGEFSVEANPEDVDSETVARLAEYGVTRVSLGAQSFSERKLKALERQHTATDIRRSVDLVRAAGLSVGVDLIYAAPDETNEEWLTDLTEVIAISPDHISTYGLTFERGTMFWRRRDRGELLAISEEPERQMYEAAVDRLTAAGFLHYEVSNFARPGSYCRHNERYWLGDEYYAAGPGAARYLGGVRSINHRSTTAYIRAVLAGQRPIAESECLGPRERAGEVLVFALRRMAGVDRRWFQEKTGFIVDDLLGPMVTTLRDHGLLADDGERVTLTRKGILVSDSLFSQVLTRL